MIGMKKSNENSMTSLKGTPKVSIVTIVRNDPPGFLATANSVIQQDYSNIEWIVVDGLSTDLTSHYVRKLSNQITHCKIEKDNGIYHAMNKGIDMATGEWLFFMNADDTFYAKDTVSRYMNDLEESDDFLYADCERREDGCIHIYRPPDKYWLGMIMDHQTICGRTSIYKKLKIDESYRIAGDFDFLSRARWMNCSFRKIPWLVGCRKAFSVGVSSSFTDRQEERLRVIKKYFGNTPYRNFLADEYQLHLEKGNITEEEHAVLLALLEGN